MLQGSDGVVSLRRWIATQILKEIFRKWSESLREIEIKRSRFDVGQYFVIVLA